MKVSPPTGLPVSGCAIQAVGATAKARAALLDPG
jgi:hypothetical protein